MNLKIWEEIIQQIVRDADHEPKESGKYKVVLCWRSKLAKEPHFLQLYQIDGIMQDVHERLKAIQQYRSLSRLTVATSAVRV